jgi:CheY-like chemotaxis protein
MPDSSTPSEPPEPGKAEPKPSHPEATQAIPATVTLAISPSKAPPDRSLDTILNAAKLLAITLVWVVVAALLLWYAATGAIGRFIGAIDVSQIEAFGVKVNVDSQKRDLLNQLKADETAKATAGDNSFFVDSEAVQQALKRAEINGGAMRGARLLWVDDQPENNTTVVDLLSQIGITVVAVTNNPEALARLEAAEARGQAFDAIVTDGSRPEDGSAKPPLRSMRLCKPVYLADANRETNYGGLSADEAAARNRDVDAGHVVGGFRLAEDIASVPALSRYTAISAPRLLMYSASNGDVSYSPCFRTITRYTAMFFQALISVVEESRPPVAIVAPQKAVDTSKPQAG